MINGADIQVDQGDYLRIHNAIMELLAKAPLRGQQFRCLMFLFRKTYGFNKKEDKISLAQWAEGTGLRRQNIWRELQSLISCNVIYMISCGPKRPNIWGFNKRYEQWNFGSVIADDYKSVIADDDSLAESVIADDYSEKPSVIVDDYRSVITPHESTKDIKDKQQSSLLAANESDDAKVLMIQAYQTVCKFGPPMREPKGRADLAIAMDLISRFGYQACTEALSRLKERHNTMLTQNGRRGIEAPLPYLRTMMEGDLSKPSLVVPATVDFALEDVSQ